MLSRRKSLQTHPDAELACGALVHDPIFTLYEGMSAMELMDPKMDAGMNYTEVSNRISSFEGAVEVQILRWSGWLTCWTERTEARQYSSSGADWDNRRRLCKFSRMVKRLKFFFAVWC